jgi:hypothetical protein
MPVATTPSLTMPVDEDAAPHPALPLAGRDKKARRSAGVSAATKLEVAEAP